MANNYQYCVDLQEVDISQRQAINKIILRVLSTAGRDAQSYGFGVDAMSSNNSTWVLSRLAIELDARPVADDKYSISTWISDFGRVVSTRNFELIKESGELFGAAVSQWCIIDINSRTAIDLNPYRERASKAIEDKPSPIAPPARMGKVTPTKSLEHSAGYCDIDFNGHMNTIRYVELMLDMIPISYLKSNNKMRIDLQFLHESLYGEELMVECEESDGEYLFEIKKQDGTPSVRGSFKFTAQ